MLENLSVDIATLPKMEEVAIIKHPRRVIFFFLINRFFGAIFLLIPVAILWYTDINILVNVALAVWVIYLILFVINTFKEYSKRGYALRQHDIIYRKGWLFFSSTVVPFTRIQHTELAEGPLNRMFKLASLKIYTAGGSTSDLTIPGLEYEDAQKLREFIAQKSAENG